VDEETGVTSEGGNYSGDQKEVGVNESRKHRSQERQRRRIGLKRALNVLLAIELVQLSADGVEGAVTLSNAKIGLLSDPPVYVLALMRRHPLLGCWQHGSLQSYEHKGCGDTPVVPEIALAPRTYDWGATC
jgi:hypothetical protein